LADGTRVETTNTVAPAGNEISNRQQLTVTRIVRGTKVGERVKRLHDFTCQICGTRLVTPAGAYAETCHIKPLGRPHNGADVPENILCLCPNCHVLLNELAVWINDDHSIEERGGFFAFFQSTRFPWNSSNIIAAYVAVKLPKRSQIHTRVGGQVYE
jgi:hypothetical protein